MRRSIIIACAVAAAMAGPIGCRSEAQQAQVNQEKFERLEMGMSPAQAREIFGEPDRVEAGGATIAGIGGTTSTMTWNRGPNRITATFVNDKLVAKNMETIPRE